MIDLMPYLEELNESCDGWIDSSYGNDVCQSVCFEYSDTTRLKIWIDSDNPCNRESDYQFTVVFEADDDENEVMLSTDDWLAVLLLIEETHDAENKTAYEFYR